MKMSDCKYDDSYKKIKQEMKYIRIELHFSILFDRS